MVVTLLAMEALHDEIDALWEEGGDEGGGLLAGADPSSSSLLLSSLELSDTNVYEP